jgi:membrane-bound lytic murein transglycosylase B
MRVNTLFGGLVRNLLSKAGVAIECVQRPRSRANDIKDNGGREERKWAVESHAKSHLKEVEEEVHLSVKRWTRKRARNMQGMKVHRWKREANVTNWTDQESES